MQSDTLLMAVVLELLVLILLNLMNKIQITRQPKKKIEPPKPKPEHGEPHPIAHEILGAISASHDSLRTLVTEENAELKQTLNKVLEVSGTQMKALQYLMDFVQQAQRPR